MVWKPHVTVAAVVERDGRFLLVQERDAGRQVFNQPAGHLEDGEGLVAAVQREVLEETGWQFRPQALIGIYRWRHPARQITFLRFSFAGTAAACDEAREIDPDIEAVLWLTPAEIRQRADSLRSPMVLRSVDDYLAGNSWPLAVLSDLD